MHENHQNHLDNNPYHADLKPRILSFLRTQEGEVSRAEVCRAVLGLGSSVAVRYLLNRLTEEGVITERFVPGLRGGMYKLTQVVRTDDVSAAISEAEGLVRQVNSQADILRQMTGPQGDLGIVNFGDIKTLQASAGTLAALVDKFSMALNKVEQAALVAAKEVGTS